MSSKAAVKMTNIYTSVWVRLFQIEQLNEEYEINCLWPHKLKFWANSGCSFIPVLLSWGSKGKGRKWPSWSIWLNFKMPGLSSPWKVLHESPYSTITQWHKYSTAGKYFSLTYKRHWSISIRVDLAGKRLTIGFSYFNFI